MRRRQHAHHSGSDQVSAGERRSLRSRQGIQRRRRSYFWSAEEVDSKLKNIMVNIYHNIDDASKKYGMEGDYVAGANIAGFLKVVNAMEAQGIV